MKSENWISSTGRMPVSAAPTAAPASPSSLMGVSITRSGPKRFRRSPDTPKAPPYTPTSSPNRNTRGSASIACASASRIASAYDSSFVSATGRAASSIGIDVSRQLRRIRIGARLREFERLVDLTSRCLFNGRELRCFHTALRHQFGFEEPDGIALAPGIDFVLGTVEIAIALRMAAPAIRLALDERWPVAGPRATNGLGRGGSYDRQIVAVDRDSGHCVRACSIGDVRYRHGERDVHRHAVFVVLADENDRQLPDRRHVECFVKSPLVGSAVAEEHHAHTILLLHLDAHADADGDRQPAPDDAVGAEIAALHVGDVHRAAATMAIAVLLAEELCEH